MLLRASQSILIHVRRSMFEVWRRSTPMRSAETHQTFYFEISFLQLLFLHHLPKIILNDGIHVVFHHIISYPSCQGFLPLNSFSCLNNLHLQLLHMSAQSLKLWVQVVVDRINLSIEIHCQVLLSFKDPINHCFYLALLSLWWWFLVR